MPKSNYSYKTSLPAYLANAAGKDMQAKLILYVVKKYMKKKATLKGIQDRLRIIFNIKLPQSTISGRVNDLVHSNKLAYFGEQVVYKEYLRKVYEVVSKENNRRRRVKKGVKVMYKKAFPVLCRIVRGKYVLTMSDKTVWTSVNGKTWAGTVSKKQIKKKK